MSQARASKHWAHPTYRYAYVREHRGMACTVIHGSYPLSTGLVWKPASKARAMEILEERLRIYQGASVPTSLAARTCEDLFREFVSVRWSKLSKVQQGQYERSFDLVPPNLNVNDTPAIRAAILEAVDETNYSPNTLVKVFKRIRTVFAFGIEEGWLRVNPVHKDMVPAWVYSLPTPYTEAEVSLVHTMPDTSKYKPYLLFLIGSGCRPVEGLRLEWQHVHEDHCVVYSYKNGRRSAKFRVIPWTVCPEAKAAVDLARQRVGKDAVHVFGMNNYQKAAQAFNELLGTAGRGLYDIRKYVINRWKREGVPEVVRHAMAGHDEAIADQHYETHYSAVELASMVQASRAPEGSSTPSEAA